MACSEISDQVQAFLIWVERSGGFEVVIDGANVGYYGLSSREHKREVSPPPPPPPPPPKDESQLLTSEENKSLKNPKTTHESTTTVTATTASKQNQRKKAKVDGFAKMTDTSTNENASVEGSSLPCSSVSASPACSAAVVDFSVFERNSKTYYRQLSELVKKNEPLQAVEALKKLELDGAHLTPEAYALVVHACCSQALVIPATSLASKLLSLHASGAIPAKLWTENALYSILRAFTIVVPRSRSADDEDDWNEYLNTLLRNFKQAVEVLERMKVQGVPLKPRSYASLFAGIQGFAEFTSVSTPACKASFEPQLVSEAMGLIHHADVNEVILRESDLTTLLRTAVCLASSDSTGDESFFLHVLRKLQQVTSVVGEDTQRVIEHWYQKRRLGMRTDQACMEYYPEVRHLVLNTTQSNCPSCGQGLGPRPLLIPEREDLLSIIKATLLSGAHHHRAGGENASKTRSFVIRYDMIDVIVSHCLQLGYHHLALILHKRHLNPSRIPPSARPLVERWQRLGIVFGTPYHANDDMYWLYATLYSTGRRSPAWVISNDQMRDHLFHLKLREAFVHWRKFHCVKVSFSGAHICPYDNELDEGVTPGTSTSASSGGISETQTEVQASSVTSSNSVTTTLPTTSELVPQLVFPPNLDVCIHSHRSSRERISLPTNSRPFELWDWHIPYKSVSVVVVSQTEANPSGACASDSQQASATTAEGILARVYFLAMHWLVS